MPVRPLITIDNDQEFRRQIRKAGSEVRKAVREYDKKIAAEAGQYAPEFAPEATGRLKRSLKTGADGKGAWVSAGTGVRTVYVPIVHWGWPARNIPRSGFLIRGLAKVGREHGGNFSNYYLEGLKEVLEQIGEVT